MDDDLENLPEADLIAEWHRRVRCDGALTYSDDGGWGCSRDLECPMMQEVVRRVTGQN